MVCCSLILNSIRPNSAYWHFNSSLLNAKNFKDNFNFFSKTFRTTKNTFQSLRQWWDFGKVQMKQFCQQHTRNITVQLSKSMKNLEASIVKLQELAESAGGRDVLEALTMKKLNLVIF